jgi:hypothetical protein
MRELSAECLWPRRGPVPVEVNEVMDWWRRIAASSGSEGVGDCRARASAPCPSQGSRADGRGLTIASTEKVAGRRKSLRGGRGEVAGILRSCGSKPRGSWADPESRILPLTVLHRMRHADTAEKREDLMAVPIWDQTAGGVVLTGRTCASEQRRNHG